MTLRTAPLSTVGFAQLEQSVIIPTGVVSVSIVLAGFAPTDLATAGTVIFDHAERFERQATKRMQAKDRLPLPRVRDER